MKLSRLIATLSRIREVNCLCTADKGLRGRNILSQLSTTHLLRLMLTIYFSDSPFYLVYLCVLQVIVCRTSPFYLVYLCVLQAMGES